MESFGNFCDSKWVGTKRRSPCSAIECSALKNPEDQSDCEAYKQKQKTFWSSPIGIVIIILLVLYAIYIFYSLATGKSNIFTTYFRKLYTSRPSR